MIDISKFNSIQQAAWKLMSTDLEYLFTVIKNIKPHDSNYIPSLSPYMGVIIDGIEDWVKSYNNSSRNKIVLPLFTKAEQVYYEEMRTTIKLWQYDYSYVYCSLESIYHESEAYFSSVCKPIAKTLRLYDIFGVDRADRALCGNTILCHYYIPSFSYSKPNGELIKQMAVIGGRYIDLFNAQRSFSVDSKIEFDTIDYGGFLKSPVGNKFSYKFPLLSILCQINFLLICVNQWISEEIPTKLRFMYLQYYSLLHFLPEVNAANGLSLQMSNRWQCDLFRNSMAHYKLGVALKPNELVSNDPFYGLTQKYFHCDYFTAKDGVTKELVSLRNQIGDILHLHPSMIKGANHA